MKKLLLLSLLFALNFYSQKRIYIKDSITKETLPFAQIKIGNIGIYSNADGFFVTSNDSVETVEIRYLGYQSKSVDLNQKDTILLNPLPVSLDTVVIKHRLVAMKVDFLHIDKRFFGSFPLSQHYEIVSTVIPNDSILIGRIKQISIKFDKIKFIRKLDKITSYRKKIKQTTNAFVRLNIYTNDTSHKLIFQS